MLNVVFLSEEQKLTQWRGEESVRELLQEFKVRITAASGGFQISAQGHKHKIDAICFFQGACLQLRIAIELLFFAALAARSSDEAKRLGQQWSHESKPSVINNKLKNMDIKYWPEAIITRLQEGRIWQVKLAPISISPEETIELYGKINNLLHAKRHYVVADIAEDLSWVNNGLERLRDQTTHFIIYSEDSAKYVVTMRWGEDNAPHLDPLKCRL